MLINSSSGLLGIEVPTLPGSTKVIGLNPASFPLFYCTLEIFHLNKIVGLLFFRLCFVGLVATSRILWLNCSFLIVAVLIVVFLVYLCSL